MATAHLGFEKEEISKKVLMPGDPLRCKYIADNFLEDAKLINNVRNNLGYTGYYKGQKITVISSGMGIPSMGIYSYELFSIYDVDYIIRIGTSGSMQNNVKVRDVILGESAYSESSFAKIYNNDDNKVMPSSHYLNEIILEKANEHHINIVKGRILTTDVFEPYAKNHILKSLVPDDLLASEMESFALFFMAKYTKKNATTLLTVTDSDLENKHLSHEEREKSLNDMITLALESIIVVK